MITATGSTEEISGIIFSADSSGIDASVTIVNQANGTVKVDKIDCNGKNSCPQLTVTTDSESNPFADIVIDNIDSICGQNGEACGYPTSCSVDGVLCGPTLLIPAPAKRYENEGIDNGFVTDNGEDNGYYYLTLSLSPATIFQIWSMLAVCIVCFFCGSCAWMSYKMKNQSLVFDLHGKSQV